MMGGVSFSGQDIYLILYRLLEYLNTCDTFIVHCWEEVPKRGSVDPRGCAMLTEPRNISKII